MLIPTTFRNCTAFLCADRCDAETGDLERVPVATTFLVAVPFLPDARAVYAVTARHVVEGARAGQETLHLRLNLVAGRAEPFKDIPLSDGAWVTSHTSDLAAIRLTTMHQDFDVHPMDSEYLATPEFLTRRHVGPGDDVFFVGLFSSHPGSARSQPIVRFGNVSLMPDRVLQQFRLPDGQDWRMEVTAYLVEARSWGGVSGSPAFVYFPADRVPGAVVMPTDEWGNLYASSGDINDEDLEVPAADSHEADLWPRLLGVVCSHFDIRQDVALKGDLLGSADVAANSGVAVVVPAQDIMELLMDDDLRAERDTLAEQSRAKRPTATADALAAHVVAIPSPDTNEFEQFEDLTRKLVNVPKKELDEKRKEAG